MAEIKVTKSSNQGIKVSDNDIAEMKLGISTFAMGCTLAKYQGTYKITTVEKALAIRLAARSESVEYPTYIILNLAHPTVEKASEFRGGNGPQAYKNLIEAGWKLIARMRGAHESDAEQGEYTSFLMGARTAKDTTELKSMLTEELLLEDEAVTREKVSNNKTKKIPNIKFPVLPLED